MMPAATRRLSERQFYVLASLCFLRFNYRLYGHRHFPGWTQNDSLLAQRIDALATNAAAMCDGTLEAERYASMFALFQPTW